MKTLITLIAAACLVATALAQQPNQYSNPAAETVLTKPAQDRAAGSDLLTSDKGGRPVAAPFVNALAYAVPGMSDVIVRRGEVYRQTGSIRLTIDLYTPPGTAPNGRRPVVIFVFGYPDPIAENLPGVKSKLKDFGPYVSWARLVAAAGMIGVTYETLTPDSDLEAVVAHLERQANTLNLDPARMALWSCSGNAPTAMAYAMQERRAPLKAAVFYYGFMPTPDDLLHEEISSVCTPRGCYVPPRGAVPRLRSDLPLLVVRAGRDEVPFVNASIDHFIDMAKAARVPLIYVDFAAGMHGFDFKKEENARSAEIIAQTLGFLAQNLAP
jgi:dienelactone hydrolase